MQNLPHLTKTDPKLAELIRSEVRRQQSGLEMIASENIVSVPVLEALGTPLTNKYSEGYYSKRYYGGNEYIDEIELLAIERAKQLFGAEHVNVQPHAGSQANMAAYFALIKPGDTVLAMNLAHGGHLTHGAAVNFSGQLYHMVHYGVRQDTGLVDMDEVRSLALKEKPKLIIAGFSAYPRHLDFAQFRAIADEVGAYLLVDMAHFAGLVAAKLHPDPVPHADVVTTTTHKTLRGPRGAMILSKTEDRFSHVRVQQAELLGKVPEKQKTLAQRIDSAVFPGMQGGPLDHVIAAKAVGFLEALQPDFVQYQKQVLINAHMLAETLLQEGLKLVSGGTDNHLLLVDLSPLGIGGKVAETALDAADIYTNKNMIPFDTRSPFDPSGIRVGTPALTSRGMKEGEMQLVGQWMAQLLRDPQNIALQEEVRDKVHGLARAFPIYPEWQ